MNARPAAHYNNLQGAPESSAIAGDSSQMKKEFSRNLQAAMIRKGWNQSELARRATDHLPTPAKGQKRGKVIGRDNISNYVRGTMLPGPAYLEAISKALGVQSGQLMPFRPPRGHNTDTPPFEVVSAGEGRVYIRVSRTVRQATAMKIMGLLANEDEEA